jgi:amino acid adenylation domain-containing protein
MSDKTGSLDQRKNLSPAKQALLDKRLQAAMQHSAEQPTIPHRTRQGFAPLSYGQEGLWFISQLDSSTPVYNRPVALRLNGDLDQTALKRALLEILRRHEVLRGRYRIELGRPLQEINPSAVLDLPMVDMSAVPLSEREEKARDFANRQARIPLNLARSPLLRLCLIRLSACEHILLLVFHHITFDAWSERVLLKELSVLYGAFSAGAPSPLAEPIIQYADYAVWQRELMESSEFQSHLAYWKNKLGDLPPALELPPDYPRPALYSNRGARYPLNLPAALVAALKELGLRQNATLSMVLLSAYLTLLYRYTGQPDALIGMPVAGRTLVELESLIGLFINSLVLRCNLGGEPTFLELLERLRQVVLEAMVHQEVPLGKLVAEINPQRDPGRTPFFQVLFNYKNIPDRSVQFNGLDAAPYELDLEVAPYDLTLELVPRQEGIDCTFIYNTDLYHPLTIERLAGNFLQLLYSVLASPELPVTQLPILSEMERRQLLVNWNQTEHAYPGDVCIHQIFEAQVEQSPEAVAVMFRSQQLTYAELNARANQLAHYLQQAGVRPHDLVGVCLERSLDMVVSLLGILKAGGGYLPLDPHLPAERLVWIMGISQAAIVLADSRSAEKLALCAARKVLVDSAWQEIARYSPHNCSSDVKPKNLAYTIYTSGSTGAPKGVVIAHRALCNHVRWAHQAFDLRLGDGTLQMANLNFDISVSEIFDTLTSGGRLVLTEPGEHWDVNSLIDLIIQRQITHLQVVPSALRMIIENGRFADCHTIRHVICGGEILPTDLALQFVRRSNATLHNLYGPSETCIDSTHLVFPSSDPGFPGNPHLWIDCPVSIGRPVANIRVYVLDPYLEPVPVGAGGELYIAGAGLGLGYLNDPVRTAQSFIPNPFGGPGERLYRTGDLARYAWDGSLHFLGRIDEQVKLRGYRIELGEIENALLGHPQVKQAIVLIQRLASAASQSECDSLVAYIVPEQSGSPALKELRDFLKRKLPEYILPSAFIFLDFMPLLPNGKIDRLALMASKASQLSQDEYIAPVTPLEQVLARIWGELLGVEHIGLHDNFFELGGNSMLAVRLVVRIEDLLRIHVDLHIIFQARDLQDFVEALLESSAERSLVEDVAQWLVKLDSLSDDEARAILVALQAGKG